MILGIGSDLVDIRRVERSLERFGDRFIARVFTDAERDRAEACRTPEQRAASYAKRYAAKEAATKALGTGYDQGVHFKDVGVVNDAQGRPTLELTGGALDRLRAITPAGMVARVHLSLTDEPPLAQAFVVISAEPTP